MECDMVLLAMGFLGPEKTILEELELEADARSNIKTDPSKYASSLARVYAAGGMPSNYCFKCSAHPSAKKIKW